MKVTGYRLREARKRWIARRDIAAKTFKESLWQFEGDESSLKPAEISKNFEQADLAVATLEEAQQRYNQQITISIHGDVMTLTLAVKRVGGAARLAKMWRAAAIDSGKDRYSYRELTRKTDEVHAKKMVDADSALTKAEKAEISASDLRSEIAASNAKVLEIDIDPKYIE